MIILMMVDAPEEKRKFVILYEKYCCLRLKIAVDILNDKQLAEDAVQEAFVRVAKHMENIGQPEEEFGVLDILTNMFFQISLYDI